MSEDDMEEIGGLRSLDYAAAKLDCSKSKIYRLCKQKRLELVKFDRGTRITDRSLQRLLRELITANERDDDNG